MNIQKLKTSWLKTMAVVFAASIMATGAHGAEKITVDKVANHYPWDSKVDCVTTVSGLVSSEEYEGVFTLSVKKDGAIISQVVTNGFASADGTYTNTFDCAELFGAGLYSDGSIVVDLVMKEKELGGVQLWKDGPYWAECNVGASKPEEYGYYFWWGDTVGYTNTNPGATTGASWISVKDGTEISFTTPSLASTTYLMKDNEALVNEGYIDSTTHNLVAKYDAATAHLGGSWRMPTSDEIQALLDNCNLSWSDNWNGTGVKGYEVTGKTAGYTEKSIFLPAAGYGNSASLSYNGLIGYYWSSTTCPDKSGDALGCHFASPGFFRYRYSRFCGQSVRPLRTVAK